MSKQRLTILGVQLESEAYPNVLYRVQALAGTPDVGVRSIHSPGWRQDTQSKSGKSRLWRNFWRMLCAHLSVIWRFQASAPTASTYIPYPAVAILWALSFLPRKKTRLVADVFISLYDTAIIDRQLYRPQSLLARLVYRLEKRALACADAIVVDTTENANYLARLFELPRDKFIAIPLSTDEKHFVPVEYHPRQNECKVLFIGTLIPLHGIETIAAAAGKLAHRSDISLKLVGDGQERDHLAQPDIARNNNLVWEQSWQSSEQLATAIRQADICLGIFGKTAKTARVLPFKIYAYSRMGRPIITAATECAQRLAQLQEQPPWLGVPVADPDALAEAICQLADNPQMRSELARRAADFYHHQLSNDSAHEILLNTLFPAGERRQ